MGAPPWQVCLKRKNGAGFLAFVYLYYYKLYYRLFSMKFLAGRVIEAFPYYPVMIIVYITGHSEN